MPRPRSHVRRLGSAAVGALLPLALLVGCTEDDPEPKFEDSPSAEPSSEPAESEPSEPVEPTPPAAMEGDDEAAAKAFVEYYFEVLDHAIETGDVKPLESLGAPACRSCTNIVDSLGSTYKNSGQIDGGLHDVRSVALTRLSGGAKNTATYQGGGRIESTPQRITGSGVRGLDGKYPGGISRYSFTVLQSGSRWQMSEWIVQ